MKQESAQLDAQDAQISLAKKLAPGGAGAPQNAAPSTASGAAEQTGSIEGTIVDPTGAVVVRAKMTTVDTDTGARQTRNQQFRALFVFISAARSVQPLGSGQRLPAAAAGEYSGQTDKR